MRASPTGATFGDWLTTPHRAQAPPHLRRTVLAIARRGVADSLTAGITTTADYSFSGAAAAAATSLGLRAIVYLEVFGSDVGAAAERFDRAPGRRRRKSDLVRIWHLASRALHLLARGSTEWCLSLGVPVGTLAPRRRATARTNGSSTAPGRSRRRARRPGRADRETLGRDPRGRCSGRSSCAPARASRSTTPRSPGARGRPTSPSPTAPARTRSSAAASLRSRRCALPGLRVGPRHRLARLDAVDRPVGRAESPAVSAARAREGGVPDALSAGDALRLATLDAARALGLDNEIGSLTPGKRADLTVVSMAWKPVRSR